MEIKEAISKLFSLHTFGIKLGLDNIKGFLDYLGNPEKKLKAIHIAGSNGKGSTAAFISSILTEFDYRVGLYTSPHFVRYNERIKINNEEIPDEYVAAFVTEHEKFIDEKELTFFEVTTAIAFTYFADNEVDFAVIETGLGGRLDATNVLNPLAVVITSISLEHTNVLGTEIDKIAFEKGAIIKPGTKVFTGKLNDPAAEVIQKKCEETKSELFRIEDYINEGEHSLELYTEEIELNDWTMPLKGMYQKYNAALAGLAICKCLYVKNFNLISLGIKNVLKNTGLQGRYEYFNKKPDIIFDSAHNPEGVSSFLKEFERNYDNYSSRILLFGAMRDKNISEMLTELNKYFDEIHAAGIKYERALKVEELVESGKNLGISLIPEQNGGEFVEKFRNKPETHCLVVLGSIYLLGEIKSYFTPYNYA